MTIRRIFDRDTILHLRIPFSFFLLPVFCFGVSQASSVHVANMLVIFVALHLFIYPGSNAYNSYMDKDKGSIGGLEKPPPVTKNLFYASIIFDTAGLLICLFANWRMAVVMACYVLFSKAYSWHGVRLKKYAIGGWATVAVFQGGYTFMMANMAAVNDVSTAWFTIKNISCMIFASLIIGGSYPLTQIYQHGEDSERGDITISYRLGITGTFLFTALFFSLASGIAFIYFQKYYNISQFFIFIGCTLPVVVYFGNWFLQASKNKNLADFPHAMFMNKISSICMIICFCTLIIVNRVNITWSLW
jgi:1,4-dihydroxy-2-naphthoate octaprenyltransferase